MRHFQSNVEKGKVKLLSSSAAEPSTEHEQMDMCFGVLKGMMDDVKKRKDSKYGGCL